MLSLEEALQTIRPGEESEPYQVTLKEEPSDQPEAKNESRFKSN